MKTIYRLTAAALAVMMALCSCTKDDGAESGRTTASRTSGGSRVITLSYGRSTKVVMDGLVPKFKAGDRILVSDGVETETCIVSVSGDGVASITTMLEGDLKAAYPADAAVVSGATITGVMPPAVQGGRLADAIIGIADNIPEGATSATFDISAAILRFYVDESIGVKRITVTSASADISAKGRTITIDGGSTLDAVTDDPDKRVCYMAVPEGISAGTLTFTSETTTQGTVTRRSPSTSTLAVRKIYNAFIPYYIDLGDKGKWGYCNVGAFYPEDSGEYFAWGAVEGQTSPFSTPFDHAHAPYWSGSDYTKYEYPDVKRVLEPGDDAAAVKWGDPWRMPIIDEFDILRPGTPVTVRTTRGCTFGASAHWIFMPATGYGSNLDLYYGTSGYYWSSSKGVPSGEAKYLNFDISGGGSLLELSRHVGFPIRPVYGPLPPTPDLTLPLTIDPLPDGGTY